MSKSNGGARTLVVISPTILARVLRVSRTTVWNWIRSGSLKAGRGNDTPKAHYQIPRSAVVERWGLDTAKACDNLAAEG